MGVTIKRRHRIMSGNDCWDRLKLQTTNFVHGLATRTTKLLLTNSPLSGRGQSHAAHSRILHPGISLLNSQKYLYAFGVILRKTKLKFDEQ